jgi:hypothetical protein
MTSSPWAFLRLRDAASDLNQELFTDFIQRERRSLD